MRSAQQKRSWVPRTSRPLLQSIAWEPERPARDRHRRCSRAPRAARAGQPRALGARPRGVLRSLREQALARTRETRTARGSPSRRCRCCEPERTAEQQQRRGPCASSWRSRRHARKEDGRGLLQVPGRALLFQAPPSARLTRARVGGRSVGRSVRAGDFWSAGRAAGQAGSWRNQDVSISFVSRLCSRTGATECARSLLPFAMSPTVAGGPGGVCGETWQAASLFDPRPARSADGQLERRDHRRARVPSKSCASS
jgi:hypothetical protein